MVDLIESLRPRACRTSGTGTCRSSLVRTWSGERVRLYGGRRSLDNFMRHSGVSLGDSSSREDGCVGTVVGPRVSERISLTDDPVVARSRRLVAMGPPGTVSLAQGIVYWMPPQEAMDEVLAAVGSATSGIHSYGPDEGNPVLRDALRQKLAAENGLSEYDVFVTHGAQQAFANVVVALLDEHDQSVLFAPYYFNHKMAIQMTVGTESLLIGPSVGNSFHPDLDWLEDVFRQSSTGNKPKMVVLVNPSNPTGVVLTKEELDRASALCAEHGAWLVIDDTYENFLYDDNVHYCPSGPHVLHIFSFSKAYGMMGWRQGYLAYHKDAPGNLADQILKVQDTVPICATQVSQCMSLGALQAGSSWVAKNVAQLEKNRSEILNAISCVGEENIASSDGAIYVFCKLPGEGIDDEKFVEWLVKKHKVCVIPGSSCGAPGCIRIAFGNLPYEECKEAAQRLHNGLVELASKGMSVLQ
jgi:aspartate/methionine/tyrosine aminotransferase